MDNKEKFKIEYDDDFDAWLAEQDKKWAESQKSAPAPKPVSPSPTTSAQHPQQAAPAKPQTPASGGVFTSDVSDGIPVSRKETVKNFKLNIDESAFEEPVEQPVAEPKKSDKAIYFAAHQPTKAQLQHRREQEENRRRKQKQEKDEQEEKRRKEYKQVAHLRRVLTLLVVIVVSVVTAVYGISCINDILALNRSKDLITVTIEKDADYKSIIDTLGDMGLIKHEWFCKLMTKFRGFDDESYINGIYYLTADMGVEGMLNEMLQDRTSDKTIRLSFPEGWTIPQIFEKLDANGVCPKEYLYQALEEVEFEYGFLADISQDNSRCYYLEGYMFPDTYDFFVTDKMNGMGENPNSVIRKLLSNFDSKWNEVYQQRAEELGLSMDEVIIIASIIQKEAADKSQMEDISSVIHNRLNNPVNYPTLGCDSTKKYVSTYLTPVIGESNASAYINNYDTNSARRGLPAGPICNPGVDAIEAALNPSDTNYYYFCHNEAGKIYLASTYSEFQANWAQVLKDNEG